MKISKILGITIFLVVILAAALILLSFYHPAHPSRNPGMAALHLQITSTPPNQEGTSVIGSTDGIAIMGFVIVAIIVTPLIFRKKKKP